ncbi:MAG: hypothetical protein A3F54_00175 [Candidatus Kerfeldbacteria bacterium RIFCSPHIGHO2_12_FULL_48_17]|uniref:Cell envelope-related transcriptional attenuator domain-containing protein n=1 Tax=Candidatus Kerfeldbacteria bacterium RIFCSPHIGHO2_12_FULL_48_17 TaxID=1798542 RepID=A0A1G2BAG6_9BACT|nr:MAG: hypothetical protein A3F54_00175 [Candidatus Kerfeldbacteria bacterium RIFCSPHIGHO2_12_FULL_48_17]
MRIIKWILFGSGIGLGGILLLAAVLYLTAPARYNFLVIGSDQRGEERARSDVLMLISVPKTGKKPITVVTIPRDSLIEQPEYGMQKITHFYAFGERTDSELFGNTALTTSVVEELLDVHVDGTFEVTFDGFKNIVDKLGGVDISSGHLNGEEALAVVRDRYREGGDFARTDDQREILLSLVGKVKSYTDFKNIYAYIQLQSLSRIRWSKFAVGHFGYGFVLGHKFHFSTADIHEEVLAGAGDYVYTPEFGKELYYWVLDQAALEKLKEDYLE